MSVSAFLTDGFHKTVQGMVMKRKNTEFRQQQIIEIAAKLIFKYGSEHLTVKRIAAEVGISEAAIYRHFKSKKSIISFLLSYIEETLVAEISRERNSGEIVTLDTIERTLRRHISAIDLRKGISFQVIAETVSLGDKSLNTQATKAISRYITALRELLAEGVKSRTIREDIDLDAAATLLFGMVESLVNTWALSNCGFMLVDKYTSLWQIYREAIVRH
jgi:AcrR family transcriptional regulator